MRKDVYRLTNSLTLPTPKRGKAIAFVNGIQVEFVIIGNRLRVEKESVKNIEKAVKINVWSYNTEDELDIIIEAEESAKLINDLRENSKHFNKVNSDRERHIANLERLHSSLGAEKKALSEILQNARNVNGIIGVNIIEANKTNKILKAELAKDLELLDEKWTNVHIQFSEFKSEVNNTLVRANKQLADTKEMLDNIVSLGGKIKRDIEIGRKDIAELTKQSKQALDSLFDGLQVKFQKSKNMLVNTAREGLFNISTMIKRGQEPQPQLYLKDRGDGKTTELFTVHGKIQTR